MHFRLYYVGANGHFSGFKDIECDTDEEAIQQARPS